MWVLQALLYRGVKLIFTGVHMGLAVETRWRAGFCPWALCLPPVLSVKEPDMKLLSDFICIKY